MKKPDILEQSIQFDGNASGFDKTVEFSLDNTQLDATDVAATSNVPWMQTNSATVPEFYNEMNFTLAAAATLALGMSTTVGIFVKGNEDKFGVFYAVEMAFSAIFTGPLGLKVDPVFGRTANSTLLVAHNAPENELDDFRILPCQYKQTLVQTGPVNDYSFSCKQIVFVRTARGSGGTGIAYHPLGFGLMMSNHSAGTALTPMGIRASMSIQRFTQENQIFNPGR